MTLSTGVLLVAVIVNGDDVTIYVDGEVQSYRTDGTVGILLKDTVGKGYHGNFIGDIDEIKLLLKTYSLEEIKDVFLNFPKNRPRL